MRSVRLIQETADIEATLVHVDPGEVVLRCPKTVQVQPTERFVMEHMVPGASAPVWINALGQVIGLVERGDATYAQIRLTALHSTDGRSQLEAMLRGVLEVTDIDPAAFAPGSGGWFYRFPEIEQAPAPAVTAPRPDERRRQKRIPVRAKVTYRIGRQKHRAMAYNVSSGGVFVLTKGVVPAKGTQVSIVYPVAVHIRPVPVTLEGAVCWAMSGGDKAGFGIVIERFENDSEEKLWTEYVDNELRFQQPALRKAG